MYEKKIKNYEYDPQKAKDILRQLEIELFVPGMAINISELKKILPINNEKQIKAIIWNLFVSEKHFSKLSGKIYNEIMDILFKRISYAERK